MVSICSWMGLVFAQTVAAYAHDALHPCCETEVCPKHVQGWLSPVKLHWGRWHSSRVHPKEGAGSSAHAGAATLPWSQQAQVPHVALWSEGCASTSSSRSHCCAPQGKPPGISGFPPTPHSAQDLSFSIPTLQEAL